MESVFDGEFPQNDEFRGCLWSYTPQTPPIPHLYVGTIYEYAFAL